MSCNSPTTAYLTADGIVWNERRGVDVLRTITIPCRSCMGCRLDYARQWAIRAYHESKEYGPRNTYVTLTYAPDKLPHHGQLLYRDFQLFIKRLRKRVGPNVRFLMCGEYGGKDGRPHFHAILFNYRAPDWKPMGKNEHGDQLYQSREMEELWTHGMCWLGVVNYQTCGYVAKYVTKKFIGDPRVYRWLNERLDPDTGEHYVMNREFLQMSRKPGIGARWFARYGHQVFDRDYVIVNGQKSKPPAYYERLHDKLLDPVILEQTKGDRAQKSHTPEAFSESQEGRLAAREVCLAARSKLNDRN